MTDPTITNAAQALLDAWDSPRRWSNPGFQRVQEAEKALRDALAVPVPEPADEWEVFTAGDGEPALRMKAAALAVPVVEETSGRVLWEGPLGALSRAWQGYGNGANDRPEDRVRVVLAADQPNEDR